MSSPYLKKEKNTLPAITDLCQSHVYAVKSSSILMRQSILNYLDAHKILVDCHHGLRAKCSCETQLLTLSHELAYNLHKGIQTNLIILDFSKAFDKVPHNKLLMKMENYGIRGNTWRWVRSFLSDRNRFYWMVKSQVKSTTSSQWCTTRISIGPFCF